MGSYSRNYIFGIVFAVSLFSATFEIGHSAASAKRVCPMFDLIVYAVLIFGFPLGILVGYRWRDRISRERRAQYLSERGRAVRAQLAGEASSPAAWDRAA